MSYVLAAEKTPVNSTERTLRIRNEKGLHARASARFAETAESFDADITVRRGEVTADGTSILDLLLLAAPHGSEISVHASGTDANAALDALAKLVRERFGEES